MRFLDEQASWVEKRCLSVAGWAGYLDRSRKMAIIHANRFSGADTVDGAVQAPTFAWSLAEPNTWPSDAFGLRVDTDVVGG